MPQRFSVVLIKPSHYDDDGYVIQWAVSGMPSNTLAVLNGLALDCKARRVLGDHVEIEVSAYDEANTRIRPERIVREIRTAGGRGLVALVGVQTNHFPRAMDIARPLRAAGVPVCMGGFHVSGCMATLPEITPELQQALDLGISLFAGEAEGRLESVLRDAWQGSLQPVYNYLKELPALAGATTPILPASQVRRTRGSVGCFDAGRGCPFMCTFCSIINVQGRKPRGRTADDVERIVRQNLGQGIERFFVADDNFARNPEWERIFDRLIEMREREKLNLRLAIQVDTMCHRLPRFIEKAERAGVRQVFIGLESINPEELAASQKKQNNIAEYRAMLQAWKRARIMTLAGYIVGFAGDTRESLRRDVEIVKRELAVDMLEPSFLTPMPGSEDHRRLHQAGAPLEPDLNKYDLEHVTREHPRMSKQEWERAHYDAWESFYSPEHIETVMRRAEATDSGPGKVLTLLIWSYASVRFEKVHPYQSGYLRRKYRKDRRPTLPVESPWVFYPRYVRTLIRTHFKIAQMIWRLRSVAKRLRRDPEARKYVDAALRPVAEDSRTAPVPEGG